MVEGKRYSTPSKVKRQHKHRSPKQDGSLRKEETSCLRKNKWWDSRKRTMLCGGSVTGSQLRWQGYKSLTREHLTIDLEWVGTSVALHVKWEREQQMLHEVRIKCLDLPHSFPAPSRLFKMQARFSLLFAQSLQWLLISLKVKAAKVCKKLQSLCDVPIPMTLPTLSSPADLPQPLWPLCNSLNHRKKPPPPACVSLALPLPGMFFYRERQVWSELCSEVLHQGSFARRPCFS